MIALHDGGRNVTTQALHVGVHLNVTDAARVIATLNMTSGDGQIYGSDGAIDEDVSGNLEGSGFDRRIHRGLPWLERQREQRGAFRLGGERWPRGDEQGGAKAACANVIWSRVSQADIGLEVIYGMRTTSAGADGKATRAQIIISKPSSVSLASKRPNRPPRCGR